MRRLLHPAVLCLALGCQPTPPPATPDAGSGALTVKTPPPVDTSTSEDGRKKDVPPLPAEAAPSESARKDAPKGVELAQRVDSYFTGHPGKRIHIQVDKPLYKPGETIWVRTWNLAVKSMSNAAAQSAITYQLISPKGAVVINKQVQEKLGMATNDFMIPAEVQGGEYLIRVLAGGIQSERPVIVSTYEAPRIKKKLEFVRKAYGAGDEVTATIEVKRPTGEALANHALTAVVRLDGMDLTRVKLTTGATGEGLVRFNLPSQIELGDGLLTVLVEDGGVTESISKSIPIILKKLQFTFFPEGGKLITGLESRLYFEAKNPLGKPADVEGRIVDDVGNAVATFSTHKNGLGRVAFTPGTGRRYRAEITRPVGVKETYPIPLAEEAGCVLRSYDDLDGEQPSVRVRVQCTDKRAVVVSAMQRETILDAATVEANDDGAIVHLKPKDDALALAAGIARVTVFDEGLNPLAERLVFRNRRHTLRVKVEPHKKSYAPRDQVALTVTTTDHTGVPRPAELAMSVVDDTVISFADDKTGHMLSRLLLEPELPGKVEEPNFYFDLTEEKSALAMDLLMGTRGWRTFEWQQVLHPPPMATASVASGMKGGGGPGRRFRGGEDDEAVPMMQAMAVPAPPPAPEPPAEGVDKRPADMKKDQAPARLAAMPAKALANLAQPAPAAPAVVAEVAAKEKVAAEAPMPIMEGQEAKREAMAEDRDWAAGERVARREAKPMPMWAPVRVFPAPTYGGEYDGPRTDFRETIHWQPTVRTGKDGTATVTFYLSDAITSFRVFTEGVGGGTPGRDETVFESSLPFSMNVKLPVEVSAGDKLLLPLTLTNERDKPLPIDLDATFGPLLTLGKSPLDGQPTLPPGERRSVFYPVEVTGLQGQSPVAFHARAGSLKDEFTRSVNVTPRGFPQVASQSGQVKGSTELTFDLGDAVPGTVDASIRLYASPVATMVSGLEGMLRQPSGCFEQTSSTNYPNVMVMQYLKEHDIDDVQLIQRSSRLLDSGYKRLVGYESPQKGYEWFGGNPGHEALTAYGLLEFADMKEVYGEVDNDMMIRTANWLKSRRDGKGGYQRDPKALDSFGAAAPDVTNAYITYSLSEARTPGIDAEVALQAELASSTQDAYLLALATNTLLNVPSRKSAGMAAAKKLAGMQESTGAWTRANHSITRSGGNNLAIETTALSVMALLKTGGHRAEIDRAVAWLNTQRGGFGQWGATQATVLSLKAMTQYARSMRRTQGAGSITVSVNGKKVGTQSYEAGRREPILFAELGKHFTAGKNVVSIAHQGGDALPYSAAVEYRTLKPASSPQSVVGLETALEKSSIKMGENVRLNVTVTNKTASGQPMTMARVGFPGGLNFQTWQLKELKEKGLIGFYETRAREVILYFRDMKPNEVKRIPIDLVATIPGQFMGPASSGYLYYNDEHKTWVDGLNVEVTP